MCTNSSVFPHTHTHTHTLISAEGKLDEIMQEGSLISVVYLINVILFWINRIMYESTNILTNDVA